MAKGVEDTALYRYVRLLALNEVGGDPGRFSLGVEGFHAANMRRAERFPHALLAGTTHDTKRSADLRARIGALAGISRRWREHVLSWHEPTRRSETGEAPDWTEELFIYQTLIGAWPISSERLASYLRKALREAKRNTNWVEPNQEWEDAVIRFAIGLLTSNEFLASFRPLAAEISAAGARSALGAARPAVHLARGPRPLRRRRTDSAHTRRPRQPASSRLGATAPPPRRARRNPHCQQSEALGHPRTTRSSRPTAPGVRRHVRAARSTARHLRVPPREQRARRSLPSRRPPIHRAAEQPLAQRPQRDSELTGCRVRASLTRGSHDDPFAFDFGD